MKKAVSLGAMIVAGLMLSSSVALAAPDQSAGRVDATARNMQKFLGSTTSSLAATDPDLAAMRDRLPYGEIMDHGTLNDKQRMLVTLVVLTAGQTLDDFKTQVNAALRVGAAPVEIREALYQCAPYIGFPRTEAAVKLMNEVFAEHKFALPLEKQSTVK